MSDLLRGYADRGTTELLSSHLLHEIEAVADYLVVIGNARIAQETKTDLLAGAGTHARTRQLDQLIHNRALEPDVGPGAATSCLGLQLIEVLQAAVASLVVG